MPCHRRHPPSRSEIVFCSLTYGSFENIVKLQLSGSSLKNKQKQDFYIPHFYFKISNMSIYTFSIDVEILNFY